MVSLIASNYLCIWKMIYGEVIIFEKGRKKL